MRNMKKTVLAVFVLSGLGMGAAQAAVTTYNNNFTMLGSGSGGLVGGTNDVVFSWDGTLNTDVNTAVSNASLSSTSPFFGLLWTAYEVMIYGAGNYSISSADTLGGAGCPNLAKTCAGDGGVGGAPGSYNVTVGTGQVMAHMKFSWGSTQGIDVVNVWTPGSWSALNPGIGNTIYTGAGGTYAGPDYDFVSTDWNGDGIAGAGMVDGPFRGFNASFNVNAVPVPAAAWLFGSGLLGLLGIARRKRKI